jgi:hypothetical protein
VLGVEGVLDDVPLSDAEMLEEFPGRVLGTLGALSAEFGRKVFHRGIECGVSIFAAQEGQKIGA